MKSATFDFLEHGSGHNRQRTSILCTFVLSLTLNITLSLCRYQSLDFAVNIINGFDVARDKVRVSLIEFSSESKIIFDFNQFDNKNDVMRAVRNVRKSDGGTATFKALNQARNALFQTRRGMR